MAGADNTPAGSGGHLNNSGVAEPVNGTPPLNGMPPSGRAGTIPVDDTLDVLVDDLRPARRDPRFRRPTPPRWAVAAGSALLALVVVTSMAVVAVRMARSSADYATARVTTGNLRLVARGSGVLQSAVYNVTFAGTGKIAAIDVRVGQRVSAGDTLARLDTTSLEDALNQAQTAVNGAQTTLDDAEASQQAIENQTAAEAAQASDQENATIYTCQHEKSPPPNCVANAEDQYTTVIAKGEAENAQAQQAVDAAQSALSAAQAQVRTSSDNLTHATLLAPHAGTVAAIYGSVGGEPGAGGPGGVFMSLLDLESVQVLAQVDQIAVGRVAAGDSAVFSVQAFGTRLFAGTVSGVSPVGQSSGHDVLYPVTVDVDAAAAHSVNLLPGMPATVIITTDARFGVTLVPAAALAFARTASAGKHPLITAKQAADALRQAQQLITNLPNDGTADPAQENATPAYVLEQSKNAWVVKPIVVGLTDGSLCEVLGGNLSAGERVVVGVQRASFLGIGGSSTTPRTTPTPTIPTLPTASPTAPGGTPSGASAPLHVG